MALMMLPEGGGTALISSLEPVAWSLLGQIGVPMSAMKEPGESLRSMTSPTRPALRLKLRQAPPIKSCLVKGPSVTFGHAEESSVEDYPSVAHALPTRKVAEYAWRRVVDEALLKFLDSTAIHKKGWFPFHNGQAQVTHRAKALRTPEPSCKIKDYPRRVSCILRQGTWWVIK